jgi:chromosomal replication initiator protein
MMGLMGNDQMEDRSIMFLNSLNEPEPEKARPVSMDRSPADPVKAEIAKADLAKNWARVRARLMAEMGDDVFSSWFGRMELARLDQGVAHLTVPTRFLKSWIDAHYADRLLAHCQAELPSADQVELAVRQTLRDPSREPAGHAAHALDRDHSRDSHTRDLQSRDLQSSEYQNRDPLRHSPGHGFASVQGVGPLQGKAQTTRTSSLSTTANDDTMGVPLDRRMTFQSFILGRSNALAFAAAERIAAAPVGSALYNPLFIHAGVGLGKTHLVQAIAQEARKLGRRVAYFTADRFMYGFVSALKSQTALAFKEKLRGIDVLILDDVQFIQGKQIQQEFGHTINALIDAGKQVIVAADRQPGDLESLDERVRSRLAGGLAVEIGPLDEELRVKILTGRIAALRNLHSSFEVAPDIILAVARAVATNGRDLDGAANRLLAHATLTGSPLTLEAAETAIRDLVRTREPKRIKIEDIQKMVATRYNVSRADILSERRTAAVVKPRQIAMYLSKSLTPRSLPEIGRRFGGRDHTTVLHAVRKIEKAVGEDRSLNDEVELIKRMLME